MSVAAQCIAPLGMESGLIPDKDITASSCYNDGNVAPQNGRLNQDIKGGAWCPRSQITTESTEWLEIDLHTVHVITGTGTQGRFGNGQGQEYAEAYVIEYWRPKLGKWVRYRTGEGQEILQGNTNTYLEKKNHLEPPIWASKIRFIPYSSHRRTVCMRVELYGCYWSVGIVAYSMPKGDKRSNGVELTDMVYDGQWGEELRGGLGQLVDGKFGGDEIREAAKNSAWVGWRNDSRPNPPTLTFEFDKVREFSAVHLYCNNKFMRDVQVFSEAIISFSIGGRLQDEPIHYTYVEDNIFENSRNVSIKLHHRIGKWVRIELRFSARWILISEVVFDSDVAQGNYTPESQKPPAGKDKKLTTLTKEVPISTAHQEDPLYVAIVVGVLTALVILLAVAIFLIVHRHRHRKCFASPLAKSTVSQKRTIDNYSGCGTSMLPENKMIIDCALDVKSDEYQEPYQALKCAPYFSYSTVLLEMKDFVKDSNTALSDSSNYDYAVPELSSAPLLTKRRLDSLSERATDLVEDIDTRRSAGGSVRSKHSTRSPSQQEVFIDLKRRLETTNVIEFPRHRLRMISKLAEGAFGTVYVAEADGVPEYNGTITSEKRLVAVKFLCHDATVLENLSHLQADDGLFECVDRAAGCPRDVYDLMCECWRRDELERPTFAEIHLFLQRKSLNYATT
ncbi:hypothetical protein SFRURICE_006510 [Spodoptera frugiperda]|nr:hypothetical protein SFRURICE_006510 [Spodoptera frugiperda]